MRTTTTTSPVSSPWCRASSLFFFFLVAGRSVVTVLVVLQEARVASNDAGLVGFYALVVHVPATGIYVFFPDPLTLLVRISSKAPLAVVPAPARTSSRQ